MSYISGLPSDTDNEGKSPGWRHCWDRVRTPNSGDDSPPPLDSAEEWQAVEEEGSEEVTTAAARAKAEADAKAKAKAQSASTGDDEEDTSFSDASTHTASSEEVTSRKRHRDEDDEVGPSKKKK